MTYEMHDQILPFLGTQGLPDPCPIRIVVTDQYIKLYIGPRDWEWDVISGHPIGTGTRCLHQPGEDIP